MKHILSFAALALLAVSLPLMFTSCGDDDDDTLDAEKIKTLVVGLWQGPQSNAEEFEEEWYYDIRADGTGYYILKVRSDVPDNGLWYASYKGKYVGWQCWKNFKVIPNSTDPTKGIFNFTWTSDNLNVDRNYSDFKGKTMVFEDDLFTRSNKTIDFITVPNPNK